MIRVIVVDDHTVVRLGLLQILSEAPDIVVVGQASSGRQALSLVREMGCDVLVLDIAMPEGSGLEILGQVRKLRPEARTLILSIYPEDQYGMRMLRAGAAGYLTKDSAPEELIAAIRQVAIGRRYITQALAETMTEEFLHGNAQDAHALLSVREYEVMCMLAEGKTVHEIAAELDLSPKTVSTYRGRILDKLGLKNTAEIIRYAIRKRLVD
jgi:two-component system invasion response regulator UvrY